MKPRQISGKSEIGGPSDDQKILVQGRYAGGKVALARVGSVRVGDAKSEFSRLYAAGIAEHGPLWVQSLYFRDFCLQRGHSTV